MRAGARTARARVATVRAPGVPPVLAVLLALSASCRSDYRHRDWSNYTGPGAEHFQREEVVFPQFDDPLEPVNRVSSGFDYGVKAYVVAPFAWLYRLWVPPDAREHLAMAGEHWEYPVRVINNLLQARWSDAGEETGRFLVNTTVGILGLFDPAADWGLEPHVEDFGQTFASWGWTDSTYVYVPFLGPSTVRDGIGYLPELFVDPANLDLRVSGADGFNQLSDEIEPLRRLVQANYDAYEPARTLYLLDRRVEVENYSWIGDESAPSTQSLYAIFLDPEDETFAESGATHTVRLAKDRDLPFTLWLQRGRAPLFYLVSGLAGHRVGDSSLALAEMMYASGSSVVAISNPTNWEFIRHGATVELPGHVPSDALDLHRALTAIDRQLESEWPGHFTSRRLAGISMGAFQTLFIAANEARPVEDGLMTFDVYLALDPPVNLEHAMTTLDRFYNVPLRFPPAERSQRIEEILGKVLYLSQGELQPGMELPFTEIEAQFLIGLAFRLDLQFTLLATQDLHDRGVLLTPRSALRRAPAFREAAEYSYLEYVYAFLLPYLAERHPRFTLDEEGARKLFADCDLRSIAAELSANERVRVFANENDFLLRPEDVEWLREHLGERAHLLPSGGHLGNLHRKAIQEAIKTVVDEAAREAQSDPRAGPPSR